MRRGRGGRGYETNVCEHVPLWKRLVSRYVTLGEFDDGLQEAFLAALRAQRRYQDDVGTFTAYAGRSVVNRLLWYRQRERRHIASDGREYCVLDSLPSTESASCLECVARALRRLSPLHEWVVDHLFYQRGSLVTLSRHLGVSRRLARIVRDAAFEAARRAVLTDCDHLV